MGMSQKHFPLVIGRAKAGEPVYLIKNMNKRKKTSTSRSKKDSNVSPKGLHGYEGWLAQKE